MPDECRLNIRPTKPVPGPGYVVAPLLAQFYGDSRYVLGEGEYSRSQKEFFEKALFVNNDVAIEEQGSPWQLAIESGFPLPRSRLGSREADPKKHFVTPPNAQASVPPPRHRPNHPSAHVRRRPVHAKLYTPHEVAVFTGNF